MSGVDLGKIMIGKFKCAAVAAAVLAASAAVAAAPSTEEQKAVATLARIGTLADTLPNAPRSKSVKAITEDPRSCVSDVGPQRARICGGPATFATGQYAWLGIPYATAQRWQNPAAVAPASGSRLRYGPVCPQAGMDGDENCLTINVWAPKTAIEQPGAPLPVMVFIHGGGFTTGSGGGETEYSEFGPMGNVVTVTFNYRLGAFGFLRADKDGVRADGNYGLRDQVEALKWVRSYISHFGGDPANVTLFGESAGAMSVSLHTFDMPQSKDLFQRAIMESDPMANTYLTPAQSQTVGDDFITEVCNAYHHKPLIPLPCLASDAAWMNYLTKQNIVAAQATFPEGSALSLMQHGLVGLRSQAFQPINDNDLVTGEPYDGYAREMPHKPLIFGVNEHEGVAVAAVVAKLNAQEPTAFFYDIMLRHSFNETGANDKIRGEERYNAATYTATPRTYYSPSGEALSHVVTDYLFTCANVWVAENLSRIQTEPVRFYYFRQVPFFDLFNMAGPPADPATSPCARVNRNVCHAVELPYVFGTFGAITANSHNAYTPGFADNYARETMHDGWATFAKDGSAPGWPNFDSAHMAKVVIGTPGAGPIDIDAQAQCSHFWFTLQRPFDSLAH